MADLNDHDLRPTFEEVTETLKVLQGKEGEIHWDSGDLAHAWLDGVAYGEREAELHKLAEATDYEYHSLRERVDCSTFWSVGDRDFDLSWSHYNRARRGNDFGHAYMWLARANENQWSVRAMEKEMLKVSPKPEPPPVTLREALLAIDAAISDTIKGYKDFGDGPVYSYIRVAESNIKAAITYNAMAQPAPDAEGERA